MSNLNRLMKECDNYSKISVQMYRINHRLVLIERHRIKLFKLFIFLSISFSLTKSQVPFVSSLRNRHGSITVISAKPCQNALGQVGTCMFMWDCIKSEGLHLGTCSDRFLFGSCCHHNSTLDDADIQRPSTTTTNSNLTTTSTQTNYFTRPQFQSIGHQQQQQHETTSSPLIPSSDHHHHHHHQVEDGQQTTTSTFLQSASTLSEHLNSIVGTKHNQLNQGVNNDQALDSQVSMNITPTSWPDRLQLANDIPTTNNWSNDDKQQVVETKPLHQQHSLIQEYNNGTTVATTATRTTATPLVNEATATQHHHQQQQTDLNQIANQSNQTTNTNTRPMQNLLPIRPANNNNNHQNADSSTAILGMVPQPSTKPQSGSWFSRPTSLLANAIFHSFKPFTYLNPNRHRPQPSNNRPSQQTNGQLFGTRPQQHYRPAMMQQAPPVAMMSDKRPQNHHQQVNYNNQPNGDINVAADGIIGGLLQQTNDQTATATLESTSSSMYTTNAQNDKSDHHVVNPSSSSANYFTNSPSRPVNKISIQYNETNFNEMPSSHKHHYEVLTNTSASTPSESLSNNRTEVQCHDLNCGQNLVSSNQQQYTHPATLNLEYQQQAAVAITLMPPTTTTPTQVLNNELQQPAAQPYQVSSNINPLATNDGVHHLETNYVPRPTLSQSTLPIVSSTSSSPSENESFNNYPSYPLIFSGLQTANSNQQPTSSNNEPNSGGGGGTGGGSHHFVSTFSPIDEIHGLFVSGSSSGHYNSQPGDNSSSSPVTSLAQPIATTTTDQGAPSSGDGSGVVFGPMASDSLPVVNDTTNNNGESGHSIMSNFANSNAQMQHISSNSDTITPAPTVMVMVSTAATATTAAATSMIATTMLTTTTTTTPPPTLGSNSSSITREPVTQTSQPTLTNNNDNKTTLPPLVVAGGVAGQADEPPKRVTTIPIAGNNREATCGVTTLYPQTKVVGGKNAAFGAWPWQVSVRKVSFFGFSSTHRCGGAVISSEWIATAGHCVEDLALQSIRIRVGEYDFSSASEPYPHIERAARRKVVHPKYNFYTYENDLALVQLDQPIQFPPHIAPICLPPDNIDLLGRNATVTGWGRLNEGGTLPTVLQEVRVPIVSNDKCKDMFLNAGRPEYIPDIFLCAGYEEGGRDSCQGDSGGPLQVRGDDGKWFLAGIISWGIGCAEQNLPGVCTRISRFKLWIQSTMSSSG